MKPMYRVAVTAVLIAAATAACNGDDDTDTSAPPVPSATAGPTDPSVEETTPPPPTTTPETTTTELNPVPTAPTAPPNTTTAPIELPPVSTLVPQVPAELLTPEQLDPFNINNSRPILPEHVPVIEAYLQAIQATTLVSSTWPVNSDSPVLLGAPFAADALRRIQDAGRGRLARGEVLDVSQGVTFRPYIVGPVRDTATLLDCEIAGHYWTKVDTAEALPPDEIWPAGPGRLVEVGLRVNFVQRDGLWLWDSSQIDPAACA